MAEKIRSIQAATKNSEYEIRIGYSILNSLCINKALQNSDSTAVIVSNTLYKLHKDYIENSLKDLKNFEIILMDDKEENKSYKYAEEFLEKFINKGMTRNSFVIGIGGGVVGDFSGFLSAVYMRGIPVVQVPTTVLSMVDSSIGGKVAVNLSIGKNIAGVFHQPFFVISDLKFLDTLPENEFKNGLTESFKHALIGDKKTLKIFKENDLTSIKQETVLNELIYLSAKFKSSVVEKDEKEGGLRAILNLGHTVGHAIESVMEYKGISHGSAVSIGIKVVIDISKEMGLLTPDEFEIISSLINKYGLIESIPGLKPDDIISHMKYDKKNVKGEINFVLLHGIFKPKIKQKVDVGILRKSLERIFI